MQPPHSPGMPGRRSLMKSPHAWGALALALLLLMMVMVSPRAGWRQLLVLLLVLRLVMKPLARGRLLTALRREQTAVGVVALAPPMLPTVE